MNYITTTQLRTQTSSFVETLLAGKSIDLIHRSKNLGKISLIQNRPAKPFNPDSFLKLAKELNIPKLTEKQREKNYHEYIMNKYGKYLS